jgi:hypothetical protein
MQSSIQQHIQAEFNQAIAARNAGLEGRSRVCARRSAGLAILAYAQENNLPAPHSAFSAITWLAQQPHLPPDLQQALQTLLTRVDTHFALPTSQDPLAAAKTIIQLLLHFSIQENPHD